MAGSSVRTGAGVWAAGCTRRNPPPCSGGLLQYPTCPPDLSAAAGPAGTGSAGPAAPPARRSPAHVAPDRIAGRPCRRSGGRTTARLGRGKRSCRQIHAAWRARQRQAPGLAVAAGWVAVPQDWDPSRACACASAAAVAASPCSCRCPRPLPAPAPGPAASPRPPQPAAPGRNGATPARRTAGSSSGRRGVLRCAHGCACMAERRHEREQRVWWLRRLEWEARRVPPMPSRAPTSLGLSPSGV